MLTAAFESLDSFRPGWSAHFDRPKTLLVAHTHEDVQRVLRLAEQAAETGCWAVVVLSYEAAPSLDSALVVHEPSGFPLAWIAVFEKQSSSPDKSKAKRYWTSKWQPSIGEHEYAKALQKVRDYIAIGDTYQVNLTFPLWCRFRGDAWSWYLDLSKAQRSAYSAYIDMGDYQIVSLSPELFFERQGARLMTRPMKGTMPRGRWTEEDDELASRLATCPKNQAENVMIVDLLRNDLGKISVFGSVRVSKLFDIERYPTLLQMTSTIESQGKPGTGLQDVLRALFPSGSITGAPKVRTMEIIRELEALPRGVYTGAIGLVKPGGDSIFSVAIRTVLIDRQSGKATFGTGGGVTYDSTAKGEYEECVLKASFLSRKARDFMIFESVLLEEGRYFLLTRHISRLSASARYFGFHFDDQLVLSTFECIRLARSRGSWKVKLFLDRDGHIVIDVGEITSRSDLQLRVRLVSEPINSRDPFTYHKTTCRVRYEDLVDNSEEYDDVVFWNEREEITESTIANVVMVINGKGWTPPLNSGLLAGTFRAELLSNGKIGERIIYKDELQHAKSFFLINSVRRWMRAVLVP